MTVRLRNLVQLGAAVRKLNDRAAHLASDVAAATRKLGEREEEIILRLALAVEYRDNDTGEHTLRVARYSRIIAHQLGLPARLCRDIYLAAPCTMSARSPFPTIFCSSRASSPTTRWR